MPTIRGLKSIENIISVLVITPTMRIIEMPTLENHILIHFIILILDAFPPGHIREMSRFECPL